MEEWRRGAGAAVYATLSQGGKACVFVPRSFLFAACHCACFIFEDIFIEIGKTDSAQTLNLLSLRAPC